MARRGLTFTESRRSRRHRKLGGESASHLARCPSVVSRELRRNSTKTRGYQAVAADARAQRRRSRPQIRKVAADAVLEARVNVDLAAS